MKASVVTRRAFLEDVDPGDVVKVGKRCRRVDHVVQLDDRISLRSDSGLEFFDGKAHDVLTVYVRKDAG